MPKLPELEHFRSRLEQDFAQRARLAVNLDTRCGPVVVRDLTGLVVPSQLTGRVFDDVIRRGTTLSETRARRRVANFCAAAASRVVCCAAWVRSTERTASCSR